MSHIHCQIKYDGNQFFQNGKLITVYRARISCIPMGRACISLRISVRTVTCTVISFLLLRIYKMASTQWKPEVSRCVSWAGHEPTHLFCFAWFFPPLHSVSQFFHAACVSISFHQLELLFLHFSIFSANVNNHLWFIDTNNM